MNNSCIIGQRTRRLPFGIRDRPWIPSYSYSSSSSSLPSSSSTASPPTARITKKRTSLVQRQQWRTKTLKDRLRGRSTTTTQNTIFSGGDKALTLLRKNEELVAERMVTRLTWARKTLLESMDWFRPSSPPTTTTTTTTTMNGKSSTVHLRHETPMDQNWWFWNLLLAASPSILIAVYCEWVVKPRMVKEQEQQQQSGQFMSSTTTTTPSLSTSETWNLLVSWIQGTTDSETTIVNSSKNQDPDIPTKSSPTSSSSTSNSDQLTTKFQQLQQQMLLLEQEIKRYQNIHEEKNYPTDTTPTTTSNRVLSPMQQRRQERQQQQQQQQQQHSIETTNSFINNNTNERPLEDRQSEQQPSHHPQHVEHVSMDNGTTATTSTRAMKEEETKISQEMVGSINNNDSVNPTWRFITNIWGTTTNALKAYPTKNPKEPSDDDDKQTIQELSSSSSPPQPS